MSLGFDRELNVVNMNDSAELTAYLYDPADSPVNYDDISSIIFTVQKPDGTRSSTEGEILEDGGGFFRFTDTDLKGEYIVVAKFEFLDGQVKSTRSDFTVSDPFGSDLTDLDLANYDASNPDMAERWVAGRVWDKMEDLFDSVDGGPWMRDMTANVFAPDKLPEFIEEAIFDINVYNPPTQFGLQFFAQPIELPDGIHANGNSTLLIQGTWIAVIRHLMRSYAEQPAATGGQVTYEDRRDYLQRWGTIYQIEFQHYDHLVKMWKRQFLGLGKSKNLISNKAGRITGAPLRTRNVGRGYY